MLRALLLGLCLTSAAFAQSPAGGFTVSPVRLELAAGARAISLSIGNGALLTRTVQVEAMLWTQHDGVDHYEPATDLVVNPPVFRIAPGGKQIVRAGFRAGTPAGAVERAYRIYLQEVPDGEEPPPNQLRLLLRVGVPLFVAVDSATAPDARWSLLRTAQGIELELSNAGNQRLRLDRLALADGTDIGGLTYVLPGQAHRWPLPAGTRTPVHIAAMSDGGPLNVTLAPP